MESRSRKKTKEDQNQNPLYSDASILYPVISDDHLRPWSDLPQDLLVSILTLLASWSLPDLLSASFVCRRWRSIAAAAAASFSVPCLLLVPSHCHRPAQSRLQILAPTPKSYRSPIPSKTLRKRCVGSSSGRLIFISGNIAIISDPFTGQEIHSPKLPSQLYVLGLLTSQSLLLLLSNGSNISFWRFGTEYWRDIELAGSISGELIVDGAGSMGGSGAS